MGYLIYALFVFAVATAVYGVVRAFGKKPKFERVLEAVAAVVFAAAWAVILLPLALVSLLLYPFLGFWAFMVLSGVSISVLKQTGLIAYVEGWHLWSLFPEWVWISSGSLLMGVVIWFLMNDPVLPSWSQVRKKAVVPEKTRSQLNAASKRE